MAVGKASIRRATKAAEVKESVLTPMNSEEIQVQFMKKGKQPREGEPVRITEELPEYLL